MIPFGEVFLSSNSINLNQYEILPSSSSLHPKFMPPPCVASAAGNRSPCPLAKCSFESRGPSPRFEPHCKRKHRMRRDRSHRCEVVTTLKLQPSSIPLEYGRKHVLGDRDPTCDAEHVFQACPDSREAPSTCRALMHITNREAIRHQRPHVLSLRSVAFCRRRGLESWMSILCGRCCHLRPRHMLISSVPAAIHCKSFPSSHFQVHFGLLLPELIFFSSSPKAVLFLSTQREQSIRSKSWPR